MSPGATATNSGKLVMKHGSCLPSVCITDLSGEELEEIYTPRGFDGVWSLTTKLSVLALEGEGLPLFLNYAWVITPQNYFCPACERFKPQLMEKNGARLFAHLSVDHDHMVDFIDEQAKQRGILNNLKPIYDTCMRFSPSIICNSCNAIDSQIKAELKEIDPYFTFTPTEKKALFKHFRRNHHWVNLKKARTIWLEKREAFLASKMQAERILQDYVGTAGEPYRYKRYVDDPAKEHFFLTSPFTEADAFQVFLSKSLGVSLGDNQSR